MTNLTNLTVPVIMKNVSEAAPLVLLILAFGTFIAIGIFYTDYFDSVLSSRFGGTSLAMAVFLSVIHEAVRFGLLVASVRDFSDKKSFNGWLGLIGSIFLVWHDIRVSGQVAALWAESGAAMEVYKGLFVFLIILGLILEIRLILTVDGASLGKPEES